MKILIFIALLLISHMALAVNKCILNGNIVYQQSPCPKGTGNSLTLQPTKAPSNSGLRDSEKAALQRLDEKQEIEEVEQKQSRPRVSGLDYGFTARVKKHCELYWYYWANRNHISSNYKSALDELEQIDTIFAKFGFTRPRQWSCPSSTADTACFSKVVCGQMTNCQQAAYFYRDCGLDYLDADNDGIACDEMCQ